MREQLHRIWEMRNDSSDIVRLAWWGWIAVLHALLISPVPGGDALRVVWGIWNGGLLIVTVFRAIIQTRGILRGGAAAFRWAFWGSLIAFFGVLLSASREFGVWATRLSLPASIASLGLLVALVIAPLAFFALFVIGLVGAAFGVVGARDRSEFTQAASAGVSRLWIGVLLVLLLSALARALSLPDSTRWAIPISLPTFVALLGRRSGTKHVLPWDVGGELGRLLTRWFVHRGRLGRRVVYWDARGPVLGLLAGVAAMALNTLSVLEPLKAAELLQIVRMQSTMTLRALDQEPKAGSDVDYVLLRMDESSRRRIAEESSEPAIHAELIRRLTQAGALRIVLPAPATSAPAAAANFVNLSVATEPNQAPIDAGIVERAKRDLPKLVQAARASGRVVLATRGGPVLDLQPPPAPPPAPGAAAPRPSTPQSIREARDEQIPRQPAADLRRAVLGLGNVDLEAYSTPQLPLIPLDGAPLPALPVELLDSVRETSGNHAPGSNVRRLRKLPELLPQRVLVNFPDARVGVAFPSLDYSTVLAGGKIYQRKLVPGKEMAVDEGAWEPPDRYFKSKIVFLDSLQPSYRESPLGLMPQNELLAQATRTLLDGASFRSLDSGWQILLTLLLPVIIGYFCSGRDPFGAGWRLALVAGIVATSATLVAFSQVWVDPVTPIAGCVIACVLVTQLTYATNEGDRDLLRRFAAPQVVEELLRRPDLLALGGSRQRLCVLFADVRGFTTFTEQHRDEPERVIETINAYTTAMTETLFEFNGILDKYTGDGLMAFFPVEEREDDRACVERSVRAALAMRDATDVVTAQLREADLQPLHVGIGMHFGEAVVGLVGNLNQFNYTALGYTVVVAARLQTLAKGGEVIVSTEMDSLIRRAFETEAMPPVEVKGVSQPVTPYRVLRPRVIPLEAANLSELAAGSVHGEP